MSGYLQRLVRSVIQPAETIHPVVGSVYSPAKRVEHREAASLTEDIPNQSSTPGSLPARSADQASDSPSPPAPLTMPITVVSEEPAAPPPRPAPAEPEILVISERQPKSSTVAKEEKEEAELQRVYRPAMTEALVRSARPATPSLKANPLLPASGGVKRDLPAKREADEIKIHIGRIEVTAVQQPTARPVPLRSARKGQSLDEYLKRRDRRA